MLLVWYCHIVYPAALINNLFLFCVLSVIGLDKIVSAKSWKPENLPEGIWSKWTMFRCGRWWSRYCTSGGWKPTTVCISAARGTNRSVSTLTGGGGNDWQKWATSDSSSTWPVLVQRVLYNTGKRKLDALLKKYIWSKRFHTDALFFL